MPNLTLIDGSSYLYRAFHALPPLSNAQGEPTGALFGVVNMLRTTLKARPDYVAFVSDASGPTFRNVLYDKYKANRPPMPDELRAQIEPMLAIVSALGFPILRVSGVEADDVIGTLATQAHEQNIDVLISTGDKDLAQLVRPGITLVNTMTNSTMDPAGVMEKFGVKPEQIIDFLSLTGDTVDNVPGVTKCGPKTAAKWLAEYGSLDGVIAHADKISGKIGEYLREALPSLPLSRELVTIKTDVPLDQTVSQLHPRERDVDALRELFTRYEFKAALKEMDGTASVVVASVPSPVSPPATEPARIDLSATPVELSGEGQYELITTQTQFDSWLARLHDAPLIAFDTETTGLDAMRADIVGLSLSVQPGHACYIPLTHDYPGVPAQLPRDNVLAALKPILEDPRRPKVGQHAKYDMKIGRAHV